MENDLVNYAEPYRNLQIKSKEYVELMEERKFAEAARLAISMHDLTHSLLYITNKLYLENKNGIKVHQENGNSQEYEWKELTGESFAKIEPDTGIGN